MDSLASLHAEIKKKQQSVGRIGGAGSKSSVKRRPQAKRWMSKADIERERESSYYATEKAADEKRRESKRQKLIQDGELETLYRQDDDIKERSEAKTPSTGVSNPNNESLSSDRTSKTIKQVGDPPLSKQEVIRRLRALKEPTTLFGENMWNRFNRLRDLELARDEGSEGQRNIFQKKLREMEAKDAEEDVYQYTGAKMPHLTAKSESAKHEEAENEADDVAPSCNEDYVQMNIRKYMRLWHSEIEGMSTEDRRTKKGRSLAVTHEQTKDWLKPLQKLLRKRKLPKNILNALKDIFEAAAEREYVRANRLYLERLAIGNAPWPMGATMVGIHARAAREKIGEDKIAHVMNDEQARKYIQAVKRLLTVAQRHFPTTFSKMIL